MPPKVAKTQNCSSTNSSLSTLASPTGGGFSLDVLEKRSGYILLRVTGRDAETLFAHEAGGHRWQRIPPGEKRGRRHTSTITVAVLPETHSKRVQLRREDCRVNRCRGSGAGGQHRNTTESAVQVTHLPSGLSVRVEGERSVHQNQDAAFAVLQARLQNQTRSREAQKRSKLRKEQVGSGERGDKRRSIRTQDDRVVDHQTELKTSLKRYLRGYLEDLLPGQSAA